MTVGQLQLWIDRLWMVSGQRWLFVAVSLGCVAGASTITALVAGSQPGVAIALMTGLAVVAVIRPDSHGAFVVEVAVVWQWLAATDDVTTPWVIPFAVLLFVFHTAVALMAVTPIAAHVHRAAAPAVVATQQLRRGRHDRSVGHRGGHGSTPGCRQPSADGRRVRDPDAAHPGGACTQRTATPRQIRLTS